MTARGRYALTALAGVGLFGAHLLGFPWLMDGAQGDRLVIRTDAPRVTSSLRTDGQWPASLDGRVQVDVRPGGVSVDGPGMHRVAWSVRYRGGYSRQVGRTQLVGPFQDPASPPCALRVILGQRFLDGIDTSESKRSKSPSPLGDLVETVLDEPKPGSLAHLIASMIETQMADFDQWPIGDFRGVGAVRMRWVAMSDIDDASLRSKLAKATGSDRPISGVLRTLLDLRFEDGNVPVWLAIIPQFTDKGLELSAHVKAEVDLDSWFYQWIADLFDGDDLASSTAKNELDHALVSAFGLPPPIELGGGHRLRFAYCHRQPLEIVTGRYAAIPMYLIHDAPNGSAPILFGPAPRTEPLELHAPLAVEFELDAMNGILHALWRSGFLDGVLDQAGLAQRFNEDALVRELLSVRIGDIDLGLPPTLWQSGVKQPDLYLGVEADIAIHDRDSTTPGHLFGSVGIAFRSQDDTPLVADLTLDELELTCEPEPGLLAPCYNDLVQAFRGRAGDIHGELSQRFTALYNQIAIGRRIDLQEATLRIDHARVHTSEHMPTAVVRVDLFGQLQSDQR